MSFRHSVQIFVTQTVAWFSRNLRRFRRWQVRQVEAMRCRREWHRQLGVENAGSLDCRFKLNTHKMVFVMNSEDYMYRRGALVKARKVRWLLRFHFRQQSSMWVSSVFWWICQENPTLLVFCWLNLVWVSVMSLTVCPLPPQSQHRVAASQHERFDKWHQSWLTNHVPASAERSVMNWLMGEDEEDLIPCKTTCLSTEVKGQMVNRYQVHYSGSKAPSSP